MTGHTPWKELRMTNGLTTEDNRKMFFDFGDHSVEYCPPGVGTDVATLNPGDMILTRRVDSWMGWLISKMTKGFYSHVAVSYKPGGSIAEALEFGVEVEDIEKYRRNHHYAVVRLDSNGVDQEDMFTFIEEVVYADQNRYGYKIIASLAISILTNHNLNFGAGVGTRICSGFAAECATRAGFIFDKPPAYMTPQDLAVACRVQDPTSIVQKRHKRLTK